MPNRAEQSGAEQAFQQQQHLNALVLFSVPKCVRPPMPTPFTHCNIDRFCDRLYFLLLLLLHWLAGWFVWNWIITPNVSICPTICRFNHSSFRCDVNKYVVQEMRLRLMRCTQRSAFHWHYFCCPPQWRGRWIFPIVSLFHVLFGYQVEFVLLRFYSDLFNHQFRFIVSTNNTRCFCFCFGSFLVFYSIIDEWLW